MRSRARLVVVSNRVPAVQADNGQGRRPRNVGGLVTALQSALEDRDCLWFGWSGRSTPRKPAGPPRITDVDGIKVATIDLSRSDTRLFYSVFANQTLWPLLHSFPQRVVIRQDAFLAYRRINRRFAETLFPMLNRDDVVWVHDYHLFLVGQELRRLGWTGKIGFFLHIPFAPADIFSILPWHREILEALFAYNLVGLHTRRFAHNLLDSIVSELGGTVSGQLLTLGNRSLRVEVHPIGIDPAAFVQWAERDDRGQADRLLRPISPRHRIILGVDRLDYTKGVPDRLLAFERLLAEYPSVRGRVSMVQISAPSRSNVPEYQQEKERLDAVVGRIHGRFAEPGWHPVTYLYRAFTQQELASIYRRTDVCLVTPLRDGMNLVAKEFVASQPPADPGVLLLSKFSGAADTMGDAIIVNPYDVEGTARAIFDALRLSPAERRAHWERLMAGVRRHTARSWCDGFLDSLEQD